MDSPCQVQREKIEKELLEVKRQQSVLIGALANEEWAEVNDTCLRSIEAR